MMKTANWAIPRRLWVVVCLLLTAGAHSVSAAPQAELWPRWTAHKEESSRQIDHSAWAAFLDAYLVTETASDINLVRYGAVDAEDRHELGEYVEMLEAVQVSELSRAEQFPYWVNLYNAFTVQLILENYPVESIRDIGGLFSRGPWDTKHLQVEGTSISLNDIEHRILRPIWQDPRIHYAVNCAAMGCPNLREEPFTRQNSERLLEAGAGDYINHPRGARKDGDTLVLSSIYDWYQTDFGGTVSGVVSHLEEYARPELASNIASYEEVRFEYDWALNEAKAR